MATIRQTSYALRLYNHLIENCDKTGLDPDATYAEVYSKIADLLAPVVEDLIRDGHPETRPAVKMSYNYATLPQSADCPHCKGDVEGVTVEPGKLVRGKVQLCNHPGFHHTHSGKCDQPYVPGEVLKARGK